MSDRKPPGISWESWIDRQIVEGEQRGAFDDLEGHGKPIRDLERPHDEDWWIRAKLAREDVVVTPPTIAIRQDRDESVERALAAADDAAVRMIVGDLNDRIRAVNRSATWGPPSSVGPLDVESIVERWHAEGRGATVGQATDGVIDAVIDADIDTEVTRSAAPPGERSRRIFRRRRAG